MNQRQLPKLLTAAEVGEICRLKPRTVVRLAQQGDLPEPRIDRTRCKRWHPDDIERWLRTGRVR